MVELMSLAAAAAMVEPLDLTIPEMAFTIGSVSDVNTLKQLSALPEASTPRGALPALQFDPLAARAVALAAVPEVSWLKVGQVMPVPKDLLDKVWVSPMPTMAVAGAVTDVVHPEPLETTMPEPG